jgi:trigger factor
LNFNINNVNETEKEVEIKLTPEELIPHFDKAYIEYRKKVEIPGFRKGKVPLGMIKNLYGEAIEFEALEKIANEMFHHFTDEQNIKPVGTPSLVDMNYKHGETATFKIKYELIPDFELKKYKNLSFEKLIHKVDEVEAEDEIKRILFANATLEEAKTVSDENHVVTYDAQDLDDKKEIIIGQKATGERVNLAAENIIPEFKEALLNKSVGDKPVVSFEVQHDGHAHKHNAELTITKVEKIKLPELNDELVKKITKEKTQTVPEFKTQLKKDLETYWENQTDRKLMDDILNGIISQHEFVVPPSMVDSILDSYLENTKQRYPNKTFPADFNTEKFKESNRADAIWQAKWYLISDRIIKAENIQIDDAELEKLAEESSVKTGIEKDKLLEYYKRTESVKDRIVMDRLKEFLKSNNQITEKIDESKI